MTMNSILLAANIVLLAAVLGLAFLVLGALRALGVLTWRLDQLEVTRPARLGREGRKVGTRAPDFCLTSTDGREISLREFSGRKVLLVFTQAGCGPCHDIAPELNRVHAKGEHHVLVVNNGEPHESREWAAEVRARFPVLMQEKFALSQRYEIFATPFAFVIDEQGVIASNGIVGSAEYLGYVLAGVGNRGRPHRDEEDSDSTLEHEAEHRSTAKELAHV
jgi:methylamine dehydrogenase accessory protein MauD